MLRELGGFGHLDCLEGLEGVGSGWRSAWQLCRRVRRVVGDMGVIGRSFSGAGDGVGVGLGVDFYKM